MTVTVNKPVRLTNGSWHLSWTSDLTAPTFRIYRDGDLIATTEAYAMDVSVAAGTSPVFDIHDDTTAVTRYPATLMLQWGTVAGTDRYRVEENVSAVWTTRRVYLDEGQSTFQFVTRRLEDVTTHQFRVTAVGTNGNESTATSVSVFMVRHPDVPDVTFSYSNPDVTIAAA